MVTHGFKMYKLWDTTKINILGMTVGAIEAKQALTISSKHAFFFGKCENKDAKLDILLKNFTLFSIFYQAL